VDVVILLVFISLTLVGAGLLFFVYRLREGDFEHGDRLALTPLADDETDASEQPEDAGSEKTPIPKGLEGVRQYVEP
jgi:cbb3-type cytochrome oxidase maturation protein